LAAAESFLCGRLVEPRVRPAEARPAIDAVLKARGQVRMADLARQLGWTTRRLERAFLQHTGIRPKLFARIVRLNAVLARLDATQREAAVDLALEAGYFDQAHLLRDFRALAGRTPRAGRDSDGEMSRHFTLPARLQSLLSGE
jgi:transcriptional regulator GlxA family with amidase domain